MTWNWQELSRSLLKKAADADTVMWEMRRSARQGAISISVYNKALAEYSVYHHLWGKSFLETRDLLVDELRKLLEEGIEVEDRFYDAQQFKIHYEAIIKDLIIEINML